MSNQAERMKKWKKEFTQKGGKQVNIYLKAEAAQNLKELQEYFPEQTQTEIITQALELLNSQKEGMEKSAKSEVIETLIEKKLNSLVESSQELRGLIETKIENIIEKKLGESELIGKDEIARMIEDKREHNELKHTDKRSLSEKTTRSMKGFEKSILSSLLSILRRR